VKKTAVSTNDKTGDFYLRFQQNIQTISQLPWEDRVAKQTSERPRFFSDKDSSNLKYSVKRKP
jgi:hypothetical protein